MSVPVVPSKSAARSADDDSDNQLAWPPPDDQRFAMDVMDLETRRVMTTQEAAGELGTALSAGETAPPPRGEGPRPIAFAPSTAAKRAVRAAHSDSLDDIGP